MLPGDDFANLNLDSSCFFLFYAFGVGRVQIRSLPASPSPPQRDNVQSVIPVGVLTE